MRIGIIGATGRVGSRVLAEAKKRHHEVTAIVRNLDKLADHGIPVIKKDIFSINSDIRSTIRSEYSSLSCFPDIFGRRILFE